MSITKCVEKILDAFPEEIKSTSNFTVADHIFCIREEREAMVLPEEYFIEFHHMLAHILCVLEGARRNI